MLADLVKRSRPLSADSKLLVLGGGYSGRCLASLARALGPAEGLQAETLRHWERSE